MPKQIDIIDAAKIYQALEIKNIYNTYRATILRIKMYKDDIHYKPSLEDNIAIWACIIGLSYFPL
jgi:hypothetical protein